MSKQNPLSRNLISYIGWAIVLVTFLVGTVLVLANAFLNEVSPYTGLVTYMLMPMIGSAGIGLVILGMIVEYLRRRRKGSQESQLPVVDLNLSKTRKGLVILLAVGSIVLGVSSIGVYQSFLFTESNEFCGLICHVVMKPEYTAYQHSPHARVNCVECHIGEGAEWYVRSKISGLRQVFRVLTGTFKLPIETPVHNLRPARETCENCHWPEQFTGTMERVRWHFWQDDENTPSCYHLLMRVGGANRETGSAEGIHWHTSSRETVRYWASDKERSKIPWIEVTKADGTKVVYKNGDVPASGPPENEIRVMDCIDCHNRPTHIYRSPDEMLNNALASGTLDRHIPKIKTNAMELLDQEYPDKSTANSTFKTKLTELYPIEPSGKVTSASVEQALTVVTKIYEQCYFPEQKTDWKTHPNNIGHRSFPGCFRCHDNEHKSEQGKAISMECSLCHDFVFQGHGDAAFGPVKYESQKFQHPGGDEAIWEGTLCTDCHAPK